MDDLKDKIEQIIPSSAIHPTPIKMPVLFELLDSTYYDMTKMKRKQHPPIRLDCLCGGVVIGHTTVGQAGRVVSNVACPLCGNRDTWRRAYIAQDAQGNWV